MAHFVIWNCLAEDYAPIRPLGPHQLASWCIQHGYNVKVIDFSHLLQHKDFIEINEKHIGPETIGIGVSTSFWHPSVRMKKAKGSQKTNTYTTSVGDQVGHSNDPTQKRKLFDQNFTNMMAGPNRTEEPYWVINARTELERKYPKLDWVMGGSQSHYGNMEFNWRKIHGFAEDAFLKYLDERSNFAGVRKDFDIKQSNRAYIGTNLSIGSNEALLMEMGRGCQFECSFCSYPLIGKKKGTYIRDYKRIEDEFLYNYETFGTTKYIFTDDTFNEDMDKMEQLAKISSDLPFDLKYVGYHRLDLIWARKAQKDLLREIGLVSPFFGIESFHPEASKAIGKGWNGRMGKEFMEELMNDWKDEITFELGFIIGLPGETQENLQETWDWLVKHQPGYWIFQALYINQHEKPGEIQMSKFDRDAQKWGYKFPIPGNGLYWKQGNFNSSTANRACVEFNYASNEFVKPAGFRLMQLTAIDEDFRKIQHTKQKDINWEHMERKTAAFAYNYAKKQIYGDNYYPGLEAELVDSGE
jgi:hypothetical protein